MANVLNRLQAAAGAARTGVAVAQNLSGMFAGNGLGGGITGAQWVRQLRRASYGGVPFGVLGSQIVVGRRNVVHEYPYKDRVWVEDMGRAARRIQITGFLVENGAYGGGPVIQQRDQLIGICESAGAKTLVHPTLGTLNVSLMGTSFDERWDQARMFEVTFTFIEAGDRVFPTLLPDTGDGVRTACSLADAACGADFAGAVASALGAGASVVSMASSTAATWGSRAQALADDATNLMHMVGTLEGAYGRYFGGRTRGVGQTAATTIA
uniref:DNA circularization N-terminal domain-containing protein n=1 Tax=uncultured Pseudacidovorax sp. TaxID=679313 RepID=UPI0025D224A0